MSKDDILEFDISVQYRLRMQILNSFDDFPYDDRGTLL
jgi:hypothetical protein